MKRRHLRLGALVLILLAAAFIAYALGHPEAGFPWPNAVTYTIYGLYAAIVLALLLIPGE